MPREKRLQPGSPWVELSTTPADWKAADPALLGTMLGQLHLIRAFEEAVLELAGAGLVHGPAHSSIGQEGGAVGSIVALRSSDGVNGSHRGHHQFLAKALAHVAPDGLDPEALVTPVVQEVLQKTLAEILGLAQGYCRGRGGSMHLQWHEAGALGTNAIVGGGVPLGAGNAWAQRQAAVAEAGATRGDERGETDGTGAEPAASGTALDSDLTVSYFGDGAVNIGSVLETMNLAAAWKLPFCFFIENNLYAVSTHVTEVTAEPRLSARALGFDIPAWRVDGMDPLAVHLAMQQATELMRSGGGPAVIEAEVYRFFHQNGPYPGSAFGYRSKQEEQSWRERDPLLRMARELTALGLIDDEGLASVRSQAQNAVRHAVDALTEPDPDGKPGVKRIRPDLWPDPGFVDVGIRGDLAEIADAPTLEQADYAGTSSTGKFVDAVAAVMDRRMGSDDRIVVLGEDIHRLKGGTNGATKGLAEKYPGRVLGTPISENAFAGLGGGIALDGRYRPVVEFMYPDFMWVAADQVFNQIGKARHMFGGDNPVPLVLRTKIAMGSGYGSQHLMDPAGIFATSPGWRIMAASTPFDYVGLMNAALAIDDPVLIIEHVDLYAESGEIPDDLDYQIPYGTAAVRRPGSDVTVLTYLSMVGESARAIEQTGVDAELIDLRFLDRASLDWETVGESIRKTNAVLIVEQGAQGTSYGSWLADEIQRRFFDWLDQPVQRVTGSEASPSISKVLERAAIAKSDDVVVGLERVRAGFGRGA
ncbi:alpha-ketoacid dehydrogenase subunit alpha/beta [Herbiconiux liangxiaofengii]|uniref:alpha-ketoacid dehydrogenase subunit alpha/beta n=1 Tax=Herbiconiux liangxiaofengii TaxID=3342795 RepID=UPI0035B79D50